MKYLIIIALFLISCATPTRIVQEVQPLTAPDNMMYVIDEGRSVFLSVPSVLEENDVLLNADTTYIATKADVDAVEAGSFYNNDGTFTGTRTVTIPTGDTLVFADQSRNRLSIVDGGSVVWGASWNSQALTDLTFFPTGSGDFLITRGDATTARFEVDPDGAVSLYDTTGTAILTGRADGEVIVGANFDNGNYDFQVSFATSYFGDSVTMADLLRVNGSLGVVGPVWMTDANGFGNILIDGAGLRDFNALASGNIIMGISSGDSLTNGGSYNILLGTNVGDKLTTAENSIALGTEALTGGDLGDGNIAIGYRNLFILGEGANNTAIGYEAGNGVVSSLESVFLGESAGLSVDTANYSVYVGSNAGFFGGTLKSQNGVTVLGAYAANTAELDTSIVIGYQNFAGGTATRSIIIGYDVADSQTLEDELVIDQSATSDYLIYGHFAEDSLRFGGITTFGERIQYEVPSGQILLAGESIQVNDVINPVTGNSGPVNLTSNPQIATGVSGQIIHVIGTSDTNTITLDDGDGLKLDGGVSAVLGEDDVITFIYRNGNWIEQSRTDN